jgi:putative transposase
VQAVLHQLIRPAGGIWRDGCFNYQLNTLNTSTPMPATPNQKPQVLAPSSSKNGYATVGELLVGLSKYFVFYNGERPHQALKNLTPDGVYESAAGGGAMILEKYGAKEAVPISRLSTGTAQDEVGLEEPALPNAKNRGSAVQLRVKSSAT